MRNRKLMGQRMRTREVIRKTKKFVDFYGADLPNTTGLKTKEDCYNRLEEHRQLMEDTLSDAMTHLDNFEKELGIY